MQCHDDRVDRATLHLEQRQDKKPSASLLSLKVRRSDTCFVGAMELVVKAKGSFSMTFHVVPTSGAYVHSQAPSCILNYIFWRCLIGHLAAF